MEVFMLVEDALAFEPLATEVHLPELYVGPSSIFKETLENVWQSGITHVTIVVKKGNTKGFEKYQRRFNFGRRGGHVDVDLLPLNVDKVVPGNVLREIHATVDQLDDFILLSWTTLLTVPLHEALEAHRKRRKDFPLYSMTALYFKDTLNKKFSSFEDDRIIICSPDDEILQYKQEKVKVHFGKRCRERMEARETLSMRYNLCHTGIYICNKTVAEHFTNWYEHMEIEDYIVDCLGREFKNEEIYVTVLQSDVMFPTYPPALRIKTPRDYHNIFSEYILRFKENTPLSQKPVSGYEPQFGPLIREDATFVNNSAFEVPQINSEYLFTAVSYSIVGKNLSLGKNSVVEGCIIFENVTIGKNCSVKGSIIMNGVEIANDTVIPPGSIICSNVQVTPQMTHKAKGSLRLSRFPSMYIDLTEEEVPGTDELNKAYLWPISAFGVLDLTRIGDRYYKFVTCDSPRYSPANFKLSKKVYPNVRVLAALYRERASARASGDSNGRVNVKLHDTTAVDAEASYGLAQAVQHAMDNVTGTVAARNAETMGAIDTNEERTDEDILEEVEEEEFVEVESYKNESSSIDHEVVAELSTLTVECLENPAQLQNKVLEIKSLKISHNLPKAAMFRVAFEHGLAWIAERSRSDKELKQLMQVTNFKEFLDAFEYQFVEEEHYGGILMVCNDLRRDTDFFSQICEALYHNDIMEFEELQQWLSKNNVFGARINSFAKWIAED